MSRFKKLYCKASVVFAVVALVFTIAYMLSFVVYQTLTKGWWSMLISIVIIILILFALFFTKKIFAKKCNGKCNGCFCNKKS